MRLGLLDNLIEARRSADRSRADEVLVEANRWLRRHPFDVRVAGARDRLRAMHPVDANDKGEADGTRPNPSVRWSYARFVPR